MRLANETFPKDIKKDVISCFNKEMRVVIDQENIRYWVRQLKKVYTTFKALKETYGFGNDVQKKATAQKINGVSI